MNFWCGRSILAATTKHTLHKKLWEKRETIRRKEETPFESIGSNTKNRIFYYTRNLLHKHTMTSYNTNGLLL